MFLQIKDSEYIKHNFRSIAGSMSKGWDFGFAEGGGGGGVGRNR